MNEPPLLIKTTDTLPLVNSNRPHKLASGKPAQTYCLAMPQTHKVAPLIASNDATGQIPNAGMQQSEKNKKQRIISLCGHCHHSAMDEWGLREAQTAAPLHLTAQH